jgi:hypothetical protein
MTRNPNAPEMQRALDAMNDACIALELASESAQFAGQHHELMAMHLHLVIFSRSLGLIADRPGVASRR